MIERAKLSQARVLRRKEAYAENECSMHTISVSSISGKGCYAHRINDRSRPV